MQTVILITTFFSTELVSRFTFTTQQCWSTSRGICISCNLTISILPLANMLLLWQVYSFNYCYCAAKKRVLFAIPHEYKWFGNVKRAGQCDAMKYSLMLQFLTTARRSLGWPIYVLYMPKQNSHPIKVLYSPIFLSSDKHCALQRLPSLLYCYWHLRASGWHPQSLFLPKGKSIMNK